MTVGTIIIGSGNIGTDLLIKILRGSDVLTVDAMVGVDASSPGLQRARRLGVTTTAAGIDGILGTPQFESAQVVFDATSAEAHAHHAAVAAQHGKLMIDLTPAALGPFVIPSVNLEEHLGRPNINMVTCGGQATIPIVAAVASVVPVRYAEIVASIASKSAGPGTRANIDEFTQTTSRAIEVVGHAVRGKAIIILNPADPPLVMRDSVFCLASHCTDEDVELIRSAVHDAVSRVQKFVPGYQLKHDVQFEQVRAKYVPQLDGGFTGTKVSVFLEVTGAGHFLPSYAGNLDIMTSAAVQAAERVAELSGWLTPRQEAQR